MRIAVAVAVNHKELSQNNKDFYSTRWGKPQTPRRRRPAGGGLQDCVPYLRFSKRFEG
ncbi:hypothetical protein MNV_210047 [Candidatus Methanoperedens nitroreducens]|uniref:Uncharacterized protein n=1 Tax=Candidatus Methanoperedens nitratireducens TaxID=1392998 RepID=A0A284VNS9_9EURY|nr:hypothetical protein MNV_210047 [Candidatus Methanoperedens nitroreducens]